MSCSVYSCVRCMCAHVCVLVLFNYYSYMGELLDPGKAIAAVKDGLASVEFRQVIVQLCDEIKSLNKMEEGVSPPQGQHIHILQCINYCND